jgi:hypothetical protein
MGMSPFPQPSPVYQKPNGKWTFDIFPGGIKQEAGDYPDEESAREWLWKALRHWEVNGQDSGGTVSAITNQ